MSRKDVCLHQNYSNLPQNNNVKKLKDRERYLPFWFDDGRLTWISRSAWHAVIPWLLSYVNLKYFERAQWCQRWKKLFFFSREARSTRLSNTVAVLSTLLCRQENWTLSNTSYPRERMWTWVVAWSLFAHTLKHNFKFCLTTRSVFLV